MYNNNHDDPDKMNDDSQSVQSEYDLGSYDCQYTRNKKFDKGC